MERKFTIFALLYFVFEGKFQAQAPWEAYIRKGDLTEGFLRYDFRGLIFGGAYFRNFTVHFPVQHKTLNFITLFRTKDSWKDQMHSVWFLKSFIGNLNPGGGGPV